MKTAISQGECRACIYIRSLTPLRSTFSPCVLLTSAKTASRLGNSTSTYACRRTCSCTRITTTTTNAVRSATLPKGGVAPLRCTTYTITALCGTTSHYTALLHTILHYVTLYCITSHYTALLHTILHHSHRTMRHYFTFSCIHTFLHYFQLYCITSHGRVVVW